LLKPKRADVLVLHINRTEDPFTLSYDVSELVEDRVIKVNINVGFRVQPKTELYFYIKKELINNKNSIYTLGLMDLVNTIMNLISNSL
jgi:KUP system potassium uptake protein